MANFSKRSLDRRKWLKAASATAAVTIVAPHVLGGPGHIAPSDLIEIGVVGVGGRGLQNARALMALEDVRITAIADPAERWTLDNFYYGGVAGRIPAQQEINSHYQKSNSDFQCKGFVDFREMLSEMTDMNAVLCGTPDHLHANVSLAAMRAGKHVYCEKPLTLHINEARLVSKLAKETGLATQLGNQGHSTEGIRKTCEWIWSGAIGHVTEVHAWVPATRWNKTLIHPPTEAQQIPQGLDWDRWCGPREPVPYHSVYAPVSWRDFWQFGCGAMGDFGCHDLDSAVWALKLGDPKRIEMFPAGQTDPKLIPYGEVGYFDFDIDGGKEVRVHWYSGGPKPAHPDSMPANFQLPSRGVLFVGTEGSMLCGGAGGEPKLFPESRANEFEIPDVTLPRSNGHHRDWIDAIKGGTPASSNFEIGAHLTEITLLGVAAMRAGQMIEWDPKAMNAKNTDIASLVAGTYRQGWELT